MFFQTQTFENEWNFSKIHWTVDGEDSKIGVLSLMMNSFPFYLIRIRDPPNVDYICCRLAWTTLSTVFSVTGIYQWERL